ncbi:hypothetical protein, partial [Noviherbaspirillum pedocola]|uniref:hypothetical protein n=1 Tax=Noviherbaspirillum pedocola TaxID=2801341 RepID=UPI001F2F6620
CSSLSKTIRTARSMTSGEYLIALFFIAPFSQMLGPPRFPGRFKTLLQKLQVLSKPSKPIAQVVCSSTSVVTLRQRASHDEQGQNQVGLCVWRRCKRALPDQYGQEPSRDSVQPVGLTPQAYYLKAISNH